LYPVVRFTTADGRTVQFVSSSGSSSPPAVGDSVDVLYDPDDPGWLRWFEAKSNGRRAGFARPRPC
jgi:hypothetical protein